jgi:hypothetical protein
LPIWQVAKATLTYPGSLPPVQLGRKLAPVTYVCGELGWNNPSKEVIREFETEWKREGILCFASIGTGHQGPEKVNTSSVRSASKSTEERVAADCQQVAEEIAHRFQGQNNYFRLSVEQGLQSTEGQTTLRPGDVIVHTKAYLKSTWTDVSVDGLVGSLLRADKIFPWQTTRERFEETMESYLSSTRSCEDCIKIDEVKHDNFETVRTLELIRVSVIH